MTELNRQGYHTELSEVMTERGIVVVENLIPDEAGSEMLRAAESKLYDVYSRYKPEQLSENEPQQKGMIV